MATAKPSLPGLVLPGAVTDKATAVASVLVAIPVPMVGVASEVTLVAPPPPVAVEVMRGGELPTSPSGGLRDLCE